MGYGLALAFLSWFPLLPDAGATAWACHGVSPVAYTAAPMLLRM